MLKQQPIDKFIHQLSNKYVTCFDVYRDETLGDTPLAFMAKYKRRDEKYMISKKVKVWGVENQQYIFVTSTTEPVSNDLLNRFQKNIRDQLDQYVVQHHEHMSTIFLGVVVTDQPVGENLVKGVRKYRKLKFIKYGLHGWAEVYIAIVDLQQESVYIHPKGKPFAEPLEKMFIKEDKAK